MRYSPEKAVEGDYLCLQNRRLIGWTVMISREQAINIDIPGGTFTESDACVVCVYLSHYPACSLTLPLSHHFPSLH